MKSLYKQAFKEIEPCEEKIQETINKLLSYKSGIRSNTKKENKRSIKRIAAIISSAAALVLCAVIIPIIIIGPAHGGKDKKVIDYYREYNFELPFEYTLSNTTNVLYFKSELTMDEMCGEINNSGYTASLHDYDSLKRIFITAEKNGFSYYFIIYDKYYIEGVVGDVYTLSECSAFISIEVDYTKKEPHIYMFLFPLQFSDTAEDENIRKINCTFNEFAAFYGNTGKTDAQIDYENKTVTFFCEGNPNYSWVKGNVIMSYIESENENYINIQPQ